MRCPFCGNPDTQVLDSRPVAGDNRVRRRRRCQSESCEQRFTTYERPQLKLPNIRKSSGPPEPFDMDKLTASMHLPLRHRPVNQDHLEEMVQNVCDRALAHGKKSLASRTLGLWVLDELRKNDQIACILYASVFEKVTTIEQWRQLLEREASLLPASDQSKQMELLTQKESSGETVS